jgi:transcription antitermination factor NusG
MIINMNNNENSDDLMNFNNKDDSDIGDWYLAKATPFHEKSAIEWLKTIAKDEDCDQDIIEYYIPQVQKKEKTTGDDQDANNSSSLKSFMIGYFAVKLHLSQNLQKILYKIQRSLNTKYKIIIYRDRKMTKKEMDQMRQSSKLVKLSDLSSFEIGDEVIITHDSFQNMSGNISHICHKTEKATITLNILGRSVNIEIGLDKIKKKK